MNILQFLIQYCRNFAHTRKFILVFGMLLVLIVLSACGSPAAVPEPTNALAVSEAEPEVVQQATEESEQVAEVSEELVTPAMLRFGIDAADLSTLDPHFAAARSNCDKSQREDEDMGGSQS